MHADFASGFRGSFAALLDPDEMMTLEWDGTLLLETGAARLLAVRRAM
jgi:hypothetical protein